MNASSAHALEPASTSYLGEGGRGHGAALGKGAAERGHAAERGQPCLTAVRSVHVRASAAGGHANRVPPEHPAARPVGDAPTPTAAPPTAAILPPHLDDALAVARVGAIHHGDNPQEREDGDARPGERRRQRHQDRAAAWAGGERGAGTHRGRQGRMRRDTGKRGSCTGWQSCNSPCCCTS
jgi:hypothetical protein